jgi:hypothetical protein
LRAAAAVDYVAKRWESTESIVSRSKLIEHQAKCNVVTAVTLPGKADVEHQARGQKRDSARRVNVSFQAGFPGLPKLMVLRCLPLTPLMPFATANGTLCGQA